jgi:hypothetical protein
MNKEDLHISKDCQTARRLVPVSTTAVEICTTNPNRVALIIGAPRTAVLTVAGDASVVDGQGYVISAGGHPLRVSSVDYPSLPALSFYAIASTGTEYIAVWEVLANCDCIRNY